jgi:NitT/TauT family transport system substrate-binding protein
MRWQALASVGVVTVLLAFVQSAAAQEAGPAPRPLPQRETVKVGISSKLDVFSVVFVGAALGEFERENLDVEYVVARPSDGLVLLSTERIDVLTSSASAAFFNALAGGSDIRIVAPAAFDSPSSKQGIWGNRAFLKGQPFNPAMMKGQTIGSALGTGASSSVMIQLQLEKAGLNINDVRFRQISTPDVLPALENGAINFGFLAQSVVHHADPDKVEFLFPGYPQDWAGGAIEYGPVLLRKRREVGEAFARALVRTTRTWLQGDYAANPKVRAVFVKEFNESEEAIERAGTVLVFPPDLPIPDYLPGLLQKTYLLTPGLLTYTTPLPDERVVDRSFVQKALGH